MAGPRIPGSIRRSVQGPAAYPGSGYVERFDRHVSYFPGDSDQCRAPCQRHEGRGGLREAEDRLVLLIHDNGRGFDQADPTLSNSLGLLGMRERAAILGGQVNISSTPGKGTTVTAWFPLPSPEESGAPAAAMP